MREKQYQREKAVEYAIKWAHGRNPKYYNFDPVGGDCTSFISQCIYAGSGVMNYDLYGWYYKNGNNKSASWSGVEYLYDFLTKNKGAGPYGEEVTIDKIQRGDIAQLSFDGKVFAHSLFIIETSPNHNISQTLIATHTQDALRRSIDSYNFNKIRFIHITNVRL